jgi:molybdate transport system substrate-binding protein
MRRWAATTAAVLLVTSTAACGADSSDSSASSTGTTKLTVYAASSLTSAFTELGRIFEAQHQGVKVTFAFGGSSDLVAQIDQGAPADVFASADTATMDKAVTARLVEGTPTTFASNTLEIAVPPGNPAGITSLEDLAKPGAKVVVCAPEVPCGAAAAKVEHAAGLTIEPASEEQAVVDVLTKVESGEADAGLVYVTDVKAAGDKVTGIRFPESSAAVNTYPVAALAKSGNADLAQAFVSLVTGSRGRSVLADAGFARP